MAFRILIADDSQLHLHILTDYINNLQHVVVGKARNGVEAVILAKQVIPDLALLDINMPTMDGITACQIIQNETDIPCLLITGDMNTHIPLIADGAYPFGIVAKPINIFQLKSTIELTLKRAKYYRDLNRYKNIIQATPMLFALVGADYRYKLINNYYCTYFNKNQNDIIEKSIPEVFGADAFNQIIKKNIDHALTGKTRHFESWFELENIGKRYISFTYTPYLENNEGHPKGVVVISTDNTQFKLSQEKLENLSSIDELTKIANRRKLLESLDKEIERSARFNYSFGFLLVDIDNFKHLNDTYGHAIGDEALVYVANSLRSCIREVDTIGRIGGEEFGLIIVKSDSYSINNVLMRIMHKFNTCCFDKNDVHHKVTVSIGVAFYQQHATTRDALLEYADQAMYVAKHEGKNRFCIYDTDTFSVCKLT